jgi:hypothetical protein
MKGKFKDPHFQLWFHRMLKFVWLSFGIFGIMPTKYSELVRSSIPVLFFISVYANYISHWSTERAIEAQLESRKDNSAKSD